MDKEDEDKKKRHRGSVQVNVSVIAKSESAIVCRDYGGGSCYSVSSPGLIGFCVERAQLTNGYAESVENRMRYMCV